MINNGLKYRKELIIAELQFETSRSSGKGGQHVNKTESRVTVVFDLINSQVFSEAEKERISFNLKSRLQNGILRLSSQDSRSQHRNKDIAVERLLDVLGKAMFVPKERKKKRVSKAQKEARLKSKKQHAEKKNLRKKIRKEDY